MTLRRGASTMGCLFMLLIIAAVLYFGVDIAEAYWRAYEYQDDFRQEARFAAHTSNDLILRHLRASADSLGLPDDAKAISIRRTPSTISIDAEYDEPLQFPMHVRETHFHPHADGPL